MTPTEFRAKHLPALNEFLKSEAGVDLQAVLTRMRPAPACDPLEHQAAYRLGAIGGYEQCLLNLTSLSLVPKELGPQPKQEYGVKDTNAEK